MAGQWHRNGMQVWKEFGRWDVTRIAAPTWHSSCIFSYKARSSSSGRADFMYWCRRYSFPLSEQTRTEMKMFLASCLFGRFDLLCVRTATTIIEKRYPRGKCHIQECHVGKCTNWKNVKRAKNDRQKLQKNTSFLKLVISNDGFALPAKLRIDWFRTKSSSSCRAKVPPGATPNNHSSVLGSAESRKKSSSAPEEKLRKEVDWNREWEH